MASVERPRLDPSELQRLWQSGFERTARGICVLDAAGTVVLAVNPAFTRMHGAEPSRFVGHPPQGIYEPADAGLLGEASAKLDSAGFAAFEARHRSANGSSFPVYEEWIAIADEQDLVRYRIGWLTDLGDRETARRRRRQAERQVEAAFSQAAVGMALVDLDGTWLRENAAFRQLIGYSANELRTLTFGEITHPGDLEATAERDRLLIAGETDSYELEKRYIRADGTTVWAKVFVTLLRDDDGEPAQFLVHAHDMTLRRRVEQDLSRELGGDGAPREAILVTGLEGRVERADGPWADLLGREGGDLIGNFPTDLAHPDERLVTAAAQARLQAGEGRWERLRSRWRRGDGQWFWLSWSGFGLAGGRVLWNAREADDRVTVERAAELRGRVIDNLAEGVFLVSSDDMRIVYTNPSLALMLGYEPGQLDGRSAIEVMWPPDLDAEETAVRERAANELRQLGSSAYEGRHRRRDGTDVWCRTATSTFEHPRFGPVWVSIMSDVTEERRAREAVVVLERAKTQFLGSVSHELRTPLTSILGYTALLREDLADTECLGHVEVIERNASRQLRLVEDMLSIARIEAGEFEVLRIELDLSDLVGRELEAAEPAATAAGLALEASVEPGIVLSGDPDRLGQVLANLLGNAIKLTPSGGRVEVTLRRAGDEAIVSVADTGPGILPEERDQLFDRLFRGEQVKDMQVSGAGLGLAIARSIVAAHEGRIEAADREGPGAEFVVALPLR